jgi:hypothetical protein
VLALAPVLKEELAAQVQVAAEVAALERPVQTRMARMKLDYRRARR